jgi:nucleolar complex protein 3
MAKPHVEKSKATSQPVASTSQPSKSTRKGDADDADGELLAELDEDDFAFGSGGSDDELSVMSDASMGSMSDMSDSDLDSDLDDDDLSDDANEGWTGFDDEEAASSSENESDLERAYEGKKRRQPKKDIGISTGDLLPIRLPDGSIAPHPRQPVPAPVVPSKNRVTFADSDDDDDEAITPPERERDEVAAAAYAKGGRSDPLGQRFGRPAVKSVLEIKDTMTRLSTAREEIATLSRDIIASPDLGVRAFAAELVDPADLLCSSTCSVASSPSARQSSAPARRRRMGRH